MNTRIVINLGVLLSKRQLMGLPSSQRWLAREIGSAESTVSDYVNNGVSRIDLDVMARMLKALNEGLPKGMHPFGPGDFFSEIPVTEDDELGQMVAYSLT